jgi:hypothetical protein
MDIINILTQTIQSVGVLLILGGMLVAFFWKAAAIINLVFGFIITIIATYLVYSITADLGSTATIFIAGLGVTGVVAALGALACILEGFALSALGFWGVIVAGSPYNMFSMGAIIGAVVASVFSTGIAVFVGDRIVSTRALGMGKSSRRAKFKSVRQRPEQIQYENVRTPAPVKVKVLPEQPHTPKADSLPRPAMVVDRQEFTARKNQIDKQLENLKKETSKGKITEETSKKLQEELEKELYIIDKDLTEKLKEESEDLKRESLDIEIEIVKSRERLAALESEKSSYLKEKEELEARFQIKQIAKKEYKTKNRIYAEKIDQIDQFISQVNKRIVKLTERQGMVSQLLKSKEGELNQ